MNSQIEVMLSKYNFSNTTNSLQAMREIIQSIALSGLKRTDFFDHAAFYGGTALRIVYKLERFSEDLDFSLLEQNKNFSLDPYNDAIEEELRSYGFKTSVVTKEKKIETNIISSNIKANSKQSLISVGLEHLTRSGIARDANLNIKLEVDIDPPLSFTTEVKNIKEPNPILITVYSLPDLFASKMSAVLCRQWKTRVKGRDWYDFIWFVRKNIPLNLSHLEQRLRYVKELSPNEKLTKELFLRNLSERINSLDIKLALQDIEKFVNDPISIQDWSLDYFRMHMVQVTFIND